MNSRLQIRLFGGFEASLDGNTIPALGSGRLQSLIAYLMLHAGVALPRQEVAGVFWPKLSGVTQLVDTWSSPIKPVA